MTQSNIKIAVTGGIGSGKSSVCEVIKSMGYRVFSCDEIYLKLLQKREFLNKIFEEFDGVKTIGGNLDKKRLAEIIFNDKSAREKLNKIAHPAIMDEMFNLVKPHKLCFCEVPLLFENGYQELFDNVIVVLRDEVKRIASVCRRDNISENEAVLRIKSQYNYDNADFAKYYVIHNDGNFEDLRQKTRKTVDKIVALI